MKKKKITAIMAVIMMVAGLSACSQSNAVLGSIRQKIKVADKVKTIKQIRV